MSSPTGGMVRFDKDGGRRLRALERAVRENSSRISRLERWAHYLTGFVSANVLVAIFNLVRSLTDGSS